MDDVESLGALAEPVRRALYRWVVAQAEPVSRDQAAAGAGVPRHTAKFHLDRLVADGLLETEFRRLTGRRGPGAGRPAKLYRRSARQVTVTLPPRQYELAAQIMAAALDGGGTPEALQTAAAEVGRQAGSESSRRSATSRTSATASSSCSTARSTRSPQEHTALVCGMNLHLVGALLDGTDRRAVLDPAPGSVLRDRRRR